MSGTKDGYILHSDRRWINFHLKHSVGQVFGYRRGFGAPMRSLRKGGLAFFLYRADANRNIAFWGEFESDEELTPDAAWNLFGPRLGSPTKEVWLENSDDSKLSDEGKTRILVFRNLVVAPTNLTLFAADVVERKHSTKGWGINQDEVSKLIRTSGILVELSDPTDLLNYDEEESIEGKRQLVTHRRIERDRGIVKKAKAKWLQKDAALRCFCCGFSFVEHYGPRGRDFIEAHHKKPLSQIDDGSVVNTRVSDLLPVCANCHRMLHRKPLLAAKDLRSSLKQRKRKSR